jgi:hypothetical protein
MSSLLVLKYKGKGRASLIRNKRGGVRLLVHVSDEELYPCNKCWANKNLETCMLMCTDIEHKIGTSKFWVELDEK